MTSSIQVSEEMACAGIKVAWEDGGIVMDRQDATAIYLAMKAAEPLQQGDEVERVDFLRASRPFANIARHCAFEPDETVLYVHQGVMGDYPLTIGDFRRIDAARAALVRSKPIDRERSLILNDIAAMMSEFVDTWPNPKKIKTALALIAKTMRAALDVRALPLLKKAFRTTTAGPSGYTMEFRFPDIETLHAADNEWHAHRKAEIARNAITAIGSQSIEGEASRLKEYLSKPYDGGSDNHGS